MRALLMLSLLGGLAHADEPLAPLWRRVGADVRAGKPLVVEVHVALCDNSVIRCGGHGLGDGDDLARNLYWATTESLGGWLARAGSGWRRVAETRGDDQAPLMLTSVWRRRVDSPGARARFGGAVEVVLVAHVWRGKAIDRAIAAFAEDLFGARARDVVVDGRTLHAGGAAALVLYVGHNRWMDRDDFAWPALADDVAPKGSAAIACHTHSWIARDTLRAAVPLLYARDFLFASGGAAEALVSGFADGATLAELRVRATQGYAAAADKPYARMTRLFTNPADADWNRR